MGHYASEMGYELPGRKYEDEQLALGWIVPITVGPVTCLYCGVLVDDNGPSKTRHRDWHAKLDESQRGQDFPR